MICKLAGQDDVIVEEFAWRALGSSGTSGMPKQRTQPSAATSAHPDPNQELLVLRRRIAELEAQQTAQVEQARKSGFDQGLKQGRHEAAAEMESALDRLAGTIRDLAQVKRKVRSEAETELVRLSLAIARRILHRELTADPQSLRGVVYAALQQLQNREITRIRVFPAAVPAVRAALERNGGLSAIEIVPDGMLQPGGLLFETALGELDASVDTQLQEIERGFADKLHLR
jgi:flagellar assembly protein FliH